MAKGIQIGVAADTKAFKQGVDLGIIKPLDDAQEALDDLGKAKGLDHLERGLDDAQDATERLQKETKETARTIDQEYRQSYRSMKRSSDTGFDGAKEGMRDFKQEANSTARESAASFDGSAESIVDSFQEIAANAFQGFGPAGAAAGFAAAAGIGLAGAALQANSEKAEKMAEDTKAAFDKMVEAGGKFYTQEVQNEAIQEALKENASDIRKIAALTGLEESYVARAVALQGDERTKVIGLLQEGLDLNKETAKLSGEAGANAEVINSTFERQITLLQDRNKLDKDAGKLLAIYDAATGGTLTKREEENELIQKRNRALAEAPKQTVVKVSGDTKQLEADIARAAVRASAKLVVDVAVRAGKKIN